MTPASPRKAPTAPKAATASKAPTALSPQRPPATVASLQAAAERRWRASDPILHRVSRAHPLPAEPHPLSTTDGFATLVASIVHQQVSLAAGRTITARLTKLLGGKVTPRRVLNRTPEQLRSAGLSRSKAAFILDLADKTQRGDVEFDRFPAMADEQVLAELVAVKGIGTWTAKMFLLFHLQRPDVLPHEDLGLRLAVAEVYGVPPEHASDVMLQRREAWSPYCSVASRVLWLARRTAMGARPAAK